MPKTNSTVSGAVLRPESESCVAEVAEAEIKLDRSDKVSTLEDIASVCVIQDVSSSEESDCRPTKNVDEIIFDLLDDDDVDDDDMPVSNNIQQKCLSVSEAAVRPESESCIISVAEVEIDHNKSDTISTHEETDSDCIIQGVSRHEDWDLWPTEHEDEMTIDLMDDDHSYYRSAESVQYSTVMTSSNEIYPEYTSQAGISFSIPSRQTDVFNVATTVLPFPSLIPEPNTDELCPYSQFSGSENAVYNSALYRVAHSELMDTEVSKASGLGTENGCLMMVDSSYPVLEIVPCSDGDRVSISERSGILPQEPCSTAAMDVSGSSNITGANTDSAASSSVAATSSSSRRKASIISLV